MAHEIEDNRAFFFNKKPWHNRGIVLPHAPSFDEAMQIITQGDTYLKLPLQAVIGEATAPINNSCVVVRTNGTEGFKEFKTVGVNHELLQPSEAFNPYRNWIDSGLLELEAGGLLYEGSQAWLLGKIKQNGEKEIVKNDSIKAYILMYCGFDGSRALGAQDCTERVVCANTLAIATSEDTKNINLKHKHTKNIRGKITDIETIVARRINDFNSQVESYQYLATKKWSASQMMVYVRTVMLNEEENLKLDKGELNGKKQAIVNNVIELLDTQKGLDLVPAIRGTAWQAYNAVSDYVTHSYGHSESARITAQYFGESAKLNSKALNLALTM